MWSVIGAWVVIAVFVAAPVILGEVWAVRRDKRRHIAAHAPMPAAGSNSHYLRRHRNISVSMKNTTPCMIRTIQVVMTRPGECL